MFKIKEFVMKTLSQMKGNYPEFQVREFALNWYSKGVLNDEDLMVVEEWYAPVVEEVTTDEEITEPIIEETEVFEPTETMEEITQEIVE